MAIGITRTTFTTSRTLEYFSEAEITKQIGHAKDLWPLAIIKEAIDNSLDACESDGIAPTIEVAIGDDYFTVADNGPGIPAETVTGSLDYMTRTSDKMHYVGPTRGQQGNALKTLWAAPFVATGEPATIEVTARGVHHTVQVSVDRIAGAPKIEHFPAPAKVKTGTFWRVGWRDVASSLVDEEMLDFYSAEQLLAAFSATNPHAEFILRHSGKTITFGRSAAPWQKWPTNRPTSPHWYRPDELQSLIAATIHDDGDGGTGRTVRQWLRQFYGLAGSKLQTEVVATAGMTGMTLADLVRGDDIDCDKVRRLLNAMQSKTDPVRPERLGVIGKDWFKSSLANLYNCDPDSCRYKRIWGTAEWLPFVLEVAFGVNVDDSACRNVVVGLNWSATIKPPVYELSDMLQEKRVENCDPVTLLVHLAYPKMNYQDRGKATLAIADEIEDALQECIEKVCNDHHLAKKRAGREDRLSHAELERQRKAAQPKKVDITEAAFSVMQAAYEKVSGPNKRPANARQIMYVVRPFVIEQCGKCWSDSNYFTQKLLPTFIKENPELTKNWDVAYDPRGHFTEPHTGRVVNLGTIGVREYIAEWTKTFAAGVGAIKVDDEIHTCGPTNRFPFALFIEKEGFDTHLEHARIAERFDVAIFSTKGLSVTACRQLVEELSAAGVEILVLHDFDVTGFSILHTLRTDTRRYQFTRRPKVKDIGLRLADAKKMGLESEEVRYGKRVKKDPRERQAMREATDEERAFLVSDGSPSNWTGRRVELNAMDSEQFIAFVESGLTKAGAKKLIPNEKVLERAFRFVAESKYISDNSAKLLVAAKKHAKAMELPANLEKQVARYLKDNPTESWDAAIAAIVRTGNGK